MLSPGLLELLRAWWREARPEGWLFPGKPRINPISPRQLNRALTSAKHMAGVKKPATLHTLRHGFATPLLEANTPSRQHAAHAPAGPRHSVGMWPVAPNAATIPSLITHARTGIAPNARARRRATGWRRVPGICCQWNTSTSSSPCQLRSPRSPFGTRRPFYGLLFKASAQTVMTIAADPKRMGARVGMTSVLHTWGSALTHHPHIHMIVPSGGLSPDGAKWVACRPGVLSACAGAVAVVQAPVFGRAHGTAPHRANVLLR